VTLDDHTSLDPAAATPAAAGEEAGAEETAPRAAADDAVVDDVAADDVAAEDAAAEDAPAEEAEPERGRAADDPERARRRIRALTLGCLALFLLSVGLAVTAAVLSSQLHRDRSDRDAVRSTAGRFATALLTYDYRNLEAAKKRVLALSAGKFRQEYQQAYSGGLDVLITQTKARSEVTVTHLYVSDVSHDQAEAVVVVNQTSSGTTGTHPVIDQYVQLSLVKVGGQWKVDNVTNLTDTQPASSSTSTTAPPSK
jgi:Mce-associated membrane protein